MSLEHLNGRICVLGGGLAGCGVAYHLARMGKKVALIERRNIASGAAGRNGGMIMKIDGRDTKPEPVLLRWKYARENDRMLDAFSGQLGTDIEVWRRGSLDMACTEAEVELLKKVTRMQREDTGDDEIVYLDRKQLEKVSPPLSGVVLGARYRPSDGCLSPYKFTTALARNARRMGAEILTWTQAQEVLVRDRRVVGVRTDKGVIATDCVVNALNGWAATITPDIPVVPLRSLAVLTEPMPAVPALTFEAELHMKIVYGATQTRRGNILIGGPPEAPASFEGQYNEDVSLKELSVNTSVLTELFPSFKEVCIIRAWAGAMGNTPDGLPCVGRHPEIQGLYIGAGYPNGMSYAPVTARLLAELIAEGGASIDLKPLDPGRFRGKTYQWPERYDYTILAEFLSRK